MSRIVTQRTKALYPITLLGCLVITLYAAMFSAFPAAAGYDFRIWYAAAAVLHHGGNPYNSTQLFRQEMTLYHALPWMNAWQRWWFAQNPYVHGTLLAVMFIPSLAWSHATVYPIAFAALMLTIGASLLMLARLWPRERWRTWLLYLLLSPIAFVGPFLGQVDAIFLLAFVLALRWAERQQFFPAGCVLTIGLIKPQIIAGPLIVLFIIAWQRKALMAYLKGLAAGSLAVLLLSVAAGSPRIILYWLTSMQHFGAGAIYKQNDLSTLASLYITWLPHSLSTPLSLVLIVGWLALCLWLWRRVQTCDDQRWWIACATVCWLLVTPYAHPHDDVLLFPALWLLGSHVVPLSRAIRVPTILLFLSLWLFPLMYIIGIDRIFPLPMRGFSVFAIILLAYILIRHGLRNVRRQDHSISTALAA